MNATLVFMAAGFGTRFSGGKKQLEPVGPNGEVLMDYAVHDALAAGFKRIIFIIRRDIGAEFRSSIGIRTEKKCDVEYVFQDVADLPKAYVHLAEKRKKPWGTGQAVLACRHILHDPFCVLNADDYYGPEAFRRIFNQMHMGFQNFPHIVIGIGQFNHYRSLTIFSVQKVCNLAKQYFFLFKQIKS